ncbi:DUF7527 domain-containing protein [Halobacterium noricense]|uniref:DUF7527 domain-containing protein n=1 Tax=Halobacterium noricense TaxID=223182 RepID=UPI001E3EC385|nr:hypothetical protein [Halobacterium noricense]UHH26702.1 hypothetical protein LT974_07170 [Halobacterium noricense]
MQAHTVERVESWGSRPFSGGFRELHELADREFSGAVVADGTWLFMLNGRVIGVYEGDVEDFGDASGTVYEAPHPSVALLFSMQERGGETQAKYYTNDTPLSEASDTLKNASFTGYIELSENVLSGDYYVVYYGGRSMSAAFVGASEELVTGDEAFELADDEVGVYEVEKSPVNVTELPEAEDESASAAAAGSADDAESDEAAADEREESRTQPSESDSESAESEPTAARSPQSAPAAEAANDTATPSDSPNETADATKSSAGADDAADPRAEAAAKQSDASGDEPTDAEVAAARAGNEEGVFDQEEEWRNARSVPTIDPEKSESTDGGATRSKAASKSASTERTEQSKSTSAKSKSTSSNASKSKGGKPRSTVEKLKRAVKQRDAKLEEAAERIDNLESERSSLRERVETLEAERDELQARADDLEAQLEEAAAAGGEEATPSETDLTPAAALSGTNLFVRYGSKGKPTLGDLGPDTDLEAVNENLRIDHHTQFEAADATVDGEEYESFLEASAAYRFVSWAVRELPFEIRDAGHTDGLADLYEALPNVDRAELDGTVSVDTEEGTTSRTFDVVLRDRMGEPLVVAELNAEREPVTGEEMGALVDDATAVREGVDELSAAMYVTSSFFEPAALETASEETGGGGFLSRNDKESFVKVGRKSGYHLCLIEDRNDAFHLTVPEL